MVFSKIKIMKYGIFKIASDKTLNLVKIVKGNKKETELILNKLIKNKKISYYVIMRVY